MKVNSWLIRHVSISRGWNRRRFAKTFCLEEDDGIYDIPVYWTRLVSTSIVWAIDEPVEERRKSLLYPNTQLNSKTQLRSMIAKILLYALSMYIPHFEHSRFCATTVRAANTAGSHLRLLHTTCLPGG